MNNPFHRSLYINDIDSFLFSFTYDSLYESDLSNQYKKFLKLKSKIKEFKNTFDENKVIKLRNNVYKYNKIIFFKKNPLIVSRSLLDKIYLLFEKNIHVPDILFGYVIDSNKSLIQSKEEINFINKYVLSFLSIFIIKIQKIIDLLEIIKLGFFELYFMKLLLRINNFFKNMFINYSNLIYQFFMNYYLSKAIDNELTNKIKNNFSFFYSASNNLLCDFYNYILLFLFLLDTILSRNIVSNRKKFLMLNNESLFIFKQIVKKFNKNEILNLLNFLTMIIDKKIIEELKMKLCISI